MFEDNSALSMVECDEYLRAKGYQEAFEVCSTLMKGINEEFEELTLDLGRHLVCPAINPFPDNSLEVLTHWTLTKALNQPPERQPCVSLFLLFLILFDNIHRDIEATRKGVPQKLLFIDEGTECTTDPAQIAKVFRGGAEVEHYLEQ